jgi:hypothetical protein
MTSPLPPDFYGLHDFSSEFMMDIDFSFGFGDEFSHFDECGDDLSGSYEFDGTAFLVIVLLRAMLPDVGGADADIVGRTDTIVSRLF